MYLSVKGRSENEKVGVGSDNMFALAMRQVIKNYRQYIYLMHQVICAFWKILKYILDDQNGEINAVSRTTPE